jgi:hypothetical protein
MACLREILFVFFISAYKTLNKNSQTVVLELLQPARRTGRETSRCRLREDCAAAVDLRAQPDKLKKTVNHNPKRSEKSQAPNSEFSFSRNPTPEACKELSPGYAFCAYPGYAQNAYPGLKFPAPLRGGKTAVPYCLLARPQLALWPSLNDSCEMSGIVRMFEVLAPPEDCSIGRFLNDA